MKKNFLKISIITPVLNSEKTIEKCIQSVLNQNYNKKFIEHIIIDGGSKDNTLKIIKKYNNKINYWESYRDKGIYHALNKGIKISSGDIIGILNSDDYYYSETFAIVNKYFQSYKINYLFGSIDHKKVYHGFYPNKIWYKLNVMPSHSVSFFILKSSQIKIGLYDTNFKYSADRDLFYRLIKSNLRGFATKRNEIFGKFYIHGISSKLSYFIKIKEEFKIRVKNGQNMIFVVFLLILTMAYKLIVVPFKKK